MIVQPNPGAYYPLKAHIYFVTIKVYFISPPFSDRRNIIIMRLTKYSSEFQKPSASLRRSPRKKSQKATQRSVLMPNSETDNDTTKVNTKFNFINLQGKSICMCTRRKRLYFFIVI